MWYDNRKDAETQPVGYFAVWYRVGDIEGEPIGFQTSEDHPVKTERMLDYINNRLLGRLARTEDERIKEAKKYADIYQDIVKFQLDIDDEV